MIKFKITSFFPTIDRALLHRVYAAKSRRKSQTFAFSTWSCIQWLVQQTIYGDRAGEAALTLQRSFFFSSGLQCLFISDLMHAFNIEFWPSILLQFVDEESEKFGTEIRKVYQNSSFTRAQIFVFERLKLLLTTWR